MGHLALHAIIYLGKILAKNFKLGGTLVNSGRILPLI
jgi:hypothetical protein